MINNSNINFASKDQKIWYSLSEGLELILESSAAVDEEEILDCLKHRGVLDATCFSTKDYIAKGYFKIWINSYYNEEGFVTSISTTTLLSEEGIGAIIAMVNDYYLEGDQYGK